MQADGDALSDDAALGGKLVLRQPRRGHRFGHDSILLAAAVSARPGERAVDLGCGVGAVGLALARRVEGIAVTLVEIDPALAALARSRRPRARRLSRRYGAGPGVCRRRARARIGGSRRDEPTVQRGGQSVPGSRPPPGAHGLG
jgi:SAM-dependent methyltransferase